MQRQIVFGDTFISATLPDDTQVVSPGVTLPLEGAEDLEIGRAHV